MKASELNEWLGVITNIGVIAGLVLVAYEVKQNSDALDREQRVAYVDVLDGLRSAWQTWEYSKIENRDVAEVWYKGNAGEELDEVDNMRFVDLAEEVYRLTKQNFSQYTRIEGQPADWAAQQLIDQSVQYPGTKKVFLAMLEREPLEGNLWRERIHELAPAEFRSE